jgi:diphosphomevalonate decarboxylase
VRELRRSGVPVFFTIVAGPQLKAVCAPGVSKDVENFLRDIPGVLDTLVTGLGSGVEEI